MYELDTPISLYGQLKEMEQLILDEANNVRASGDKAVHAKADYEALKHQELLHLYTEEAAGDIKRTEKMREAIYRTKFSTERLKWLLAEREYQSQLEYLKSLNSLLISIQVRTKLVEIDRRIGSGQGA